MNRLLAACCAGLLCLCTLGGCAPSAPAAEPITQTALLLDTTCAVTVYDPADETALAHAMDRIAADERRWSRTVETSEIARLNRGDIDEVSDDTAALLRTALDWSARTDGAFDITTAPLTDLWKAAEEKNHLPLHPDVDDALTRVGFHRVTLDGNRVAMEDGTMIDPGAIAKGAIADRAAAVLREEGCDSALIDLGGNIVAVGEKPNGKPFSIGIADPKNSERLIATVLVSDGAVVTSGSYERGYRIDGTWLSHILNPKTGVPVDGDLRSVTILAANATDADALSTACYVMGYEKARAFVESLDGVEAVFVTADRSVKATAGVQFAR